MSTFSPRSALRRPTAMAVTTLKRIGLLLLLIVVGRGVFELLVVPIIDDRDPVLAFLALWLVMAYLVLPRIQRLLAGVYVPDYFVGRTRTSDGLLGDPVNLAVNGSEQTLLAALTDGGWTRADDLTLGSGFRIARSTVLRRRYPSAPVSPLFVFSRRQDLAFEQEIPGKPSHRHHVRFWRCPEGWYMPGGLQVQWVGAATYDRRVGLSAYTFQITHKIGEDTDRERDRVVETLRTARPGATVRWVRNYFSGYRARSGGGDAITTDGDLPVVELS